MNSYLLFIKILILFHVPNSLWVLYYYRSGGYAFKGFILKPRGLNSLYSKIQTHLVTVDEVRMENKFALLFVKQCPCFIVDIDLLLITAWTRKLDQQLS